MPPKVLWFIVIISLVINGIAFYKLEHKKSEIVEDEIVSLQDKYPLLSKRILTANSNDIIINFIPLREAMRNYVNPLEGRVGAYFEYLPSGTSIGVNDREEVKIVSLSKVPAVMSIYKKVERGMLSLDDTVTIEASDIDQKFGTLWQKGPGYKSTIRDLINLALKESDNTAYYALSRQLTEDELVEVYQGLDIQITNEEDGHSLISPKSYSSIFRSLYLASFLNKDHSQEILDILTQTPFNDKITAGVPSDIPVSHKIGVFRRQDITQEVFIDCGITYVPDRPYILCVFVQDNEEAARLHMSKLSKMIFGYITKVKGD